MEGIFAKDEWESLGKEEPEEESARARVKKIQELKKEALRLLKKGKDSPTQENKDAYQVKLNEYKTAVKWHKYELNLDAQAGVLDRKRIVAHKAQYEPLTPGDSRTLTDPMLAFATAAYPGSKVTQIPQAKDLTNPKKIALGLTGALGSQTALSPWINPDSMGAFRRGFDAHSFVPTDPTKNYGWLHPRTYGNLGVAYLDAKLNPSAWAGGIKSMSNEIHGRNDPSMGWVNGVHLSDMGYSDEEVMEEMVRNGYRPLSFAGAREIKKAPEPTSLIDGRFWSEKGSSPASQGALERVWGGVKRIGSNVSPFRDDGSPWGLGF